MTVISDVQFYDKYSRYNYDLGRREDWIDTVNRVTNYLFSFDKRNVLDEPLREKIFNAIYNKQVMPSMRNLAMAGQAAERTNVASYNCSAGVPDDTYFFREAVLILMAGTGLGYSVEQRFTNKLPRLEEHNPVKMHIVVEDTTEGWADAIFYSINYWILGHDVTFDVSKVRPAGTPLKIKGGRASGSDALVASLTSIEKVISARREFGFLRSIDVHDIICFIAKCIVSGGHRRSACICLFDLDDTDMLNCKSPGNIEGNEQRYLCNNSVVFEKQLSFSEIETFMNRMFDSQAGEPGIFSRYAIANTLPARRACDENFLTNPCFAPGTMIQTKWGHYPIETLVGKVVEIWDGNNWIEIDNFRVTGKKQEVYNVILHDGSVVTTTGNHRFILENGESIFAKYLTQGDKVKITDAPCTHGTKYIPGAYIKGFLTGDGTTTKKSRPILFLYHTKYMCEDRLIQSASEIVAEEQLTNSISTLGFTKEDNNSRKRMTGLSVRKSELYKWSSEYKSYIPYEMFESNLESKLEYIAGIMDADGTVFDTPNGFAYQITSVYKKWLQDFQLLLKTIGVNSKLSLSHDSCMRDFNDGYGQYKTKACWRLTISQAASIILAKQVRFSRLVDFSTKKTAYTLKPRFNKVVSVEKSHIEDTVYCCTVPTTHQLSLTCGIDTGQCGEIVLRSGQFCNLSSVVCRPEDTKDDLIEKVEIATIIGTLQSMSDYFPGLRSGWKKNQEEERLLGVDLNGIMDCPMLHSHKLLQELRTVAIDTNSDYAKRLGINQAAAITCVKPSGNASVLLNTSPGIHARWSRYYIRRMQLHKDNPILAVLQMYGVPTQPSNHLPDTYVAEFPIKSPDTAKLVSEISALEQLETWRMFKMHWTEHNPSCTISYTEEDKDKITKWVYDNQEIISGLSFLPKSDAVYEQMPYQEISETEYIALVENFPKEIDWNTLHSLEAGMGDNTSASKVSGCDGDKCLLQ